MARYFSADGFDSKAGTGRPLTHCPECGADLASPRSLLLRYAEGFTDWTAKGCLDGRGTVRFGDGYLTAVGDFAAQCSSCGDFLDGTDGVRHG